jgi:uncharacterized membrane protein
MAPKGSGVAEESEPLMRKPLLFGIIGAVILFVIGLVYLFASAPPADAASSYSLEYIIRSIGSLDAVGVIGLGIILIIATPIARTIVAAAYFSRCDRILAIIPLISMILIAAGFLLSILR